MGTKKKLFKSRRLKYLKKKPKTTKKNIDTKTSKVIPNNEKNINFKKFIIEKSPHQFEKIMPFQTFNFIIIKTIILLIIIGRNYTKRF